MLKLSVSDGKFAAPPNGMACSVSPVLHVQHHGQLVRQLALFAVLQRALLYHHLEGARVKFLVQVLRESRSELLQLNGWLP